MTLAEAVGRAIGRAVVSLARVGGGDINDAYAAELEDGARAFVKTRADAPAGEFTAEAAALRWLAEPGGLGIPEVLGVLDADGTPRLLALEWLEPGGAGDEADLGRGLATIHAAGALAPSEDPRACGSGRSRCRTFPRRRGRRSTPTPGSARSSHRRETEERSQRPASRRWRACASASPTSPAHQSHRRASTATSGPATSSGLGGRPYLIDPIAYGGHREVDLAMLRLFGAPGPRFLEAYESITPLAPGHEDRVPLYQLFPLLVHAVLFGGAYGASAERAARRYV